MMNLHLLVLAGLMLAVAGFARPAVSADANEGYVSGGGQGYIFRGINEYNYVSGPRYANMAKILFRDRPANFDYMGFRAHYALTRHYDPQGEFTLGRMMTLAYAIQTETDKARVTQALKDYETLVTEHAAHMGVILQAQALARQDRRFGDAAFFQQIYNGLLNSVMTSGTGLSQADSYDVVTMDEERALLRKLRVKMVETYFNHAGILYYNAHEVIDAETGIRYTVYVDITRPMEFLTAQAADMGRVYNIPKR